MNAFQWDCPAPVGVARLDEQHREMHRRIMELIASLETRPEDPANEDAFIEVFEVSVEHFKTEEDFLEAKGYPGLVPHRFEHELLLDWFRDQMVQRNTPHAHPMILLVREIAEILQVHHATVDNEYAVWLGTR